MTSIRFSRIGPIGVVASLTLLCGFATAQQTTSAAVAGQPNIDISGL